MYRITDDCISNQRLIYLENGKCGFKDLKGNVIIKAIFDELSGFCEGLASIGIKGKYGFVNTNGDIVIQPKYDHVALFSNGLARVCLNGNYGYINKEGCCVTDIKFIEATDYSEGLAFMVEKGFFTKTNYILRSNGKLEKLNLDARNHHSYNNNKFKDGLLSIRFKQDYYLYGFIDQDGNTKIAPQFKNTSDFSNGFCVVESHSIFPIYYFIDKQGNKAFPHEFESASSFREGIASVRLNRSFVSSCLGQSATYSFLTADGNLNGSYEYVGVFNNGLATIKAHGKYGYVNTKFDVVIEPKYDWANYFINEHAVVTLGNKTYYINKRGEAVLDIDEKKNNKGFCFYEDVEGKYVHHCIEFKWS